MILVAHAILPLMILIPKQTYQQIFCPAPCACDDQKLTVICKGSIGVNRLPHTLNPSLERLTLNDGQTSQLAGLDDYQRLMYLDIAYNKLTLVDADELSKDPHLQHLNTSHNQISELKDSQVLKNVASLLKNNLGTEDVSADVTKIMKRLPKVNIIEMNLSHNNLSTIKNLTFFRWHKLQRLDLSNNIISFLESDSLYGLINLDYLNLRGNLLKRVPSNAFQGTTRSPARSLYTDQPVKHSSSNLQTIDLSRNTIKTLESSSFNLLDKLQNLSLEFCSIETIHERSFSNLHLLSEINLEHNNLKEVPSSSFSQLSGLKVLKMSHNNIESLRPYAFDDLTNLNELSMNNQSFETIPADAFKGLNSLQRLDLALSTNLTTIEPGAFGGLVRLTYLNLSNSSLPHLLNEFADNANILVDLRNNPLRCSCELRWLTKWLQNLNETMIQLKSKRNHLPIVARLPASSELLQHPLDIIEQIVNLSCTGPKALAGKLISELPIKKLECLDPASSLNVHIGFAVLLLFLLVLVTVCTVNFCRNKNYFLVMLKTNLASNHISMMLPYKPNTTSRDEIYSYGLRKETQFVDNGDYEPVDYSQPVYTLGDQGPDQFLYYSQRQTGVLT